MNGFNTGLVTKMIVEKAAQVVGADRAVLQNPRTNAAFPCCVVQPPLQQSRYGGAGWDLSVTVEVWAAGQYEAMRVFDAVRIKLLELNLQLVNNTPLFEDPAAGKWRFGGYFECRWNAVENTLERNR